MAAWATLFVLAEIKKIRDTTLVAASLWMLLTLLAVTTAEWVIALVRYYSW